jgi:oligoribonuclease NrnB/cAMP/cGMP phosphodiesterase (DHH superfamily)
MKNIAVLYHANCVDGFVSKTLIEFIFSKDKVSSIPVRYNSSIAEINNNLIKLFGNEKIDRIYIVDFSLTYEELSILTNVCKKIIIYDHHDTAVELYKNDPHFKQFNESNLSEVTGAIISGICTSKIIEQIYGEKLFSIFVNTRNSIKDAGQSNYEQIYNENIKFFIDRINDYDVWNLEYDNTFIVNETIRCIFEDKISDQDKYDLVVKAMIYYREMALYISSNVIVLIPYDVINYVIKAKQVVYDRNAVVKHYVKTATVKKIDGLYVPFVQCPGNICNYVGHVLSSEHPFVFTYWVNVERNTVKISLRSNKYKGVNVRHIAEKHGGGGHNSAAGIEMSYDNFKVFEKLYVR